MTDPRELPDLAKTVLYQAGKTMDQTVFDVVTDLVRRFQRHDVRYSRVDDILLIEGKPYQLTWSLEPVEMDEYEKEANASNN